MQYPDDLLKIAERIVAIAHDVPRESNQWSHITHYEEPEWIVPGLYLARVLVQSSGNKRLVRAAIRAIALERDVSFTEEVQSLHDLTWALEGPLAVLKLPDLQAMVGFLECYLGSLEHELDRGDEDADEEWESEEDENEDGENEDGEDD